MEGTYTYGGAIAYCWHLDIDPESSHLFGASRLPFGPGWMVTGLGSHYRGRGHAEQVMKQILFDADREHVVLYLECSPDEDRTTDHDRLYNWYKRLGFEPFTEEDPNAMVRVPLGWTPGR